SGPDPRPDQHAIELALLAGIKEHGLKLLPWTERSRGLIDRSAFAHPFDPTIAKLDEDVLIERAGEWLPPLLMGKRRLSDINSSGLTSALEQLLGYDAMRRLDRLAPSDFTSPAGSRHDIDYPAPAGPTVEVRAQALFGLSQHP